MECDYIRNSSFEEEAERYIIEPISFDDQDSIHDSMAFRPLEKTSEPSTKSEKQTLPFTKTLEKGEYMSNSTIIWGLSTLFSLNLS